MGTAGIFRIHPKKCGCRRLPSTVVNRCVHFCIALTFLLRLHLTARQHLPVMYTPFKQSLVKLYLNHYPRQQPSDRASSLLVDSSTWRLNSLESAQYANVHSQMNYRKSISVGIRGKQNDLTSKCGTSNEGGVIHMPT